MKECEGIVNHGVIGKIKGIRGERSSENYEKRSREVEGGIVG